MSNEPDKPYIGYAALAVSLAGVLFAVVTAALGSVLGHHWTMLAFGIFAGFQVIAIALGIAGRRSPAGLPTAIASAIMLAGSALLIA